MGPSVQAHLCPDAGTCLQALRAWGPCDVGCSPREICKLPVMQEPHCLFSHSPWAVEATSDLCPWAWHPLLPNQPCPPCSKANLLTLGCVKKSTVFICRAASKENGQVIFKRSTPFTDFQGRGFTGNIWDEGCSSWTLLIGWW